MWRKSSIKQCKDCKVFPGECITTKHRLMVMEIYGEQNKNMTNETENCMVEFNW